MGHVCTLCIFLSKWEISSRFTIFDPLNTPLFLSNMAALHNLAEIILQYLFSLHTLWLTVGLLF